MRKVFAKKKLLLLSFLIPFVLATVGYHFVYICDTRVRGQWVDSSKVDIHDKVALDKAADEEEDRRLKDLPAWGVHALLLGLPAGLFSLLIVSVCAFAWSMLTRREKADDSV